jgi:23S rRNA (uridine2552-2'-O)-methyltransferase
VAPSGHGRDLDQYHRKAKEEGYLSRAVYKLDELCDEFHLIDEGDCVVDLGAAPGGWSQIARERLGPEGTVVAVDKRPIEAEDATVVRGDVTEESTLVEVYEALGGPADAVISDMAPNLSGNYSMDHARSIHLARTALDAARKLLRPGGSFAVKVFEGDLFKEFYDEVGDAFDYSQARTPKATREGSSETYVIGERLRD